MTEIALLRLRRGSGPAFEATFAHVASLLTGAEGYLRHRLVPTLDDADLYLLEVEWLDLAAHTRGFEPDDAHARFMTPLEPMLTGEPIVVHVPDGRAVVTITALTPSSAGVTRPSPFGHGSAAMFAP